MQAPFLFEPTRRAALERLDAVNPDVYARTRNYLDGAVTRLSPYLTHGLLSLHEVYNAVHIRQPLDATQKLVFEWGWRAYYRHVWAHLGDGIHASLHAGVLADGAYRTAMPEDVLLASTGVPVIDKAVHTLYETGYLHNHARMWLASYLVHIRKVHWHTGAQWMLGYLLDGDVASNHLSWQWVAGSASVKPYLFNADNVAKYAGPAWHSAGTVLDTSYEALGLLAQSPVPVDETYSESEGAGASALQPALQPALLHAPDSAAWVAPQAGLAAGRDVWLLHPWSLGAALDADTDGALLIGVGIAESHAHAPWSAQRWRFVTEGLRARTPHVWWGSASQVAHALQHARSVHWQPEAHADAALAQVQAHLQADLQTGRSVSIVRHPQAPLFTPVAHHCQSFSQWWRQTRLSV